MAELTDARLLARAGESRGQLASLRHAGDSRAAALFAPVFALVREASRRQLGLRHHRVQLIGGAAMLGRRLAEMETGEGKTITAALPAALFALAGRPVHVVTVNDYLARRDASQLAPVYGALGLSVGVVVGGQSPAERRAAYRADVVYCTNKDLVFDYLRDRLALGARRARARRAIDELVGAGWNANGPADAPGPPGGGLFLRGLHVAIVDEADSVLIDEARTPLILSGADGSAPAALYVTALDLARRLGPADRDIDARRRALALTAGGRRHLTELAVPLDGIWTARRAREELVEQALTALHFYRRDTDYVVADGKIEIVDAQTGRVMPDRTWEHGLHQMIEAREGCAVTGQRKTLARITYQRFFARYFQLCGMTGTAAENRAELAAIYGLEVLRVPTHHPLRRRHDGVLLAAHAEAKWEAVAARAVALQAAGRAVLIGTGSVGASERLAEILRGAKLAPAVLNARQSREEALVVARAGQPGALTVATDMAGRGTDIRLDRQVRDSGGLHVILTEFHESARIDRQLFGRCARQGDPGSTEAIVAADDEIFQRFASPLLLGVVRRLGRSRRLAPAMAPVMALLVRLAQARAERMNADSRRQTLREDIRLEKALAFAGRGE